MADAPNAPTDNFITAQLLLAWSLFLANQELQIAFLYVNKIKFKSTENASAIVRV
jgi:hypothetical protein